MSPRIHQGWILLLAAASLVQSATASCSRPADPENGEILRRGNSFRSGYSLRFTCNEPHFRPIPANGRVTCDGDQWEQSMQCVPALCPPFPRPLRGGITYRLGVSGVNARFHCTARGYRIQGEKKLTCRVNGTWSADPPKCLAMPICDQLEARDHLITRRVTGRRREGKWVFGSMHTLTCEDGHYMQPPATFSGSQYYPTIICERNGWNASLPTCVEYPRCPPLLDDIENGQSSSENRTYAVAETIRFTCYPGYRTTTQSWRTCAVKYTGNRYVSEWLGETPECEETTCPSVRGQLENGAAFETSVSIGANATFRCNSGYELVGESHLTCLSSGRWSGNLPVCDTGDNDCPVLGIPFHGYKTGDRYNTHDHVEFSCDSDYTLIGSDFRRCRPEGFWTGTPARCVGRQDFDSVEDLALKLRGNLDSIEANALFDVPETNETTNSVVDDRGRLIPISHHIGMELYFILDASSSVGEINFESAKRFARELVKEIGVTDKANSLRVGAIKFNSDAHVMFHTVEFGTTDKVVSAINAIDYGNGGGTNIAKAFDRLLNVMLPQSVALNRPGSFKTVFLLTDGEPTEGGDSVEKARLIENEGVTIHCIGISEDANKEILRDLASKEYDEHLFFIKDYSSLERLIKTVTNQTIDYSECGISSQTLSRDAITRKTPAKDGSWPWQVLLLVEKEGTESVCGGTLIKENWILTAAHCFHEYDSVDVYVGLVERSKRYRYQKQEVKRIINHPEYHHPTKRYDIALIELERNVTLGPNVRTACLPDPTKADRLLHRGSAIVTGWGHIGVVQRNDQQESLIPEDALHELTLELHDPEECKASLVGDDEAHWFNKTVMTCAGYLNRQVGPCRGDSGGPLIKYAKQQNNNRRWTVIGVTSWGIGCGLQNELDFFTNVPRLMPWINENINPPEDEVEEDAEPAEEI